VDRPLIEADLNRFSDDEPRDDEYGLEYGLLLVYDDRPVDWRLCKDVARDMGFE